MTTRYIRMGTLASRPNRPGLLPVCSKTLMRWVEAGQFPAPVQLSPGTKVWDRDQVETFLASKSAGAPAQPQTTSTQ